MKLRKDIKTVSVIIKDNATNKSRTILVLDTTPIEVYRVVERAIGIASRRHRKLKKKVIV